MTPFSELIISFNEKDSPGGPSAVLVLHIPMINNINSPASKKPGPIPAINNADIFVSVIIPSRIKIVLGGMSTPNVPPAAIVPAANRE